MAAVTFCGAPALSADLPTKAPIYKAVPESGWTYQVTPYLWAPSIKGSVTTLGRTADVDVSFVDLVEHSSIPKDLFGLMGSFEARNGRFSIFTDFIYMKAGTDVSGSRNFARELVAAGIAASIGLKFQQAIAEVAGTYEIARWGSGTISNGSWTALDAVGGARLWWQKATINLDVATTIGLPILPGLTFSGNRAVAGSGDVTWADPLVGLRLRHQFTPGQQLVVSGDVGGFGVGSRFSWQGIGAYSFDFAKTQSATWSGMIGYRALYADYSKGGGLTAYEFNVLQHGPMFGVGARF